MSNSLILNSPYTEPAQHWRQAAESEELEIVEGRREAGYLVANPKARAHNDSGIFVSIPLVNQIRLRIVEWRESGYPGVSGMTKRLLAYWRDQEQRDYPFFFCQIEAIETLIWWVEAPDSSKVGVDIPTDGGEFRRLCCNLATGTGKTVVMAMLIAWQVLNKTTRPQDARFSKHILVVAPGLTVRRRLEVLKTSDAHNYYDEFNIVPTALKEAEARELGGEKVETGTATNEGEQNLNKKERTEQLRERVNTVGKGGHSGEDIQKVISVGMLTEGWDARTVTHIMGLRAFSSQLLCEQVSAPRPQPSVSSSQSIR